MYYVMSDLHGQYDKFIKMLDTIGFSDDDTLFILGDIIDRGPEPIKLLEDISMRGNVYALFGNHELMALDVLHALLSDVTEENCTVDALSDILYSIELWERNGGGVTLDQFKSLPKDDRNALIEFMEEFSYYEDISIGERRFILVHSGLGNFKPDKALGDYTPEELAIMSTENDYHELSNTLVIAGHTPTITITGKAEIYKKGNYINIDCAATFGGKLACLRLDDMKEFYV